jgi:hypothetical protein
MEEAQPTAPPADAELRRRIEKLADFVAKNGACALAPALRCSALTWCGAFFRNGRRRF